MENMLKQGWEDGSVKCKQLINNPTQRVSNLDCSRIMWTNINRIRTEQGKCNYLLHKWITKNLPHCDCGQIQAIQHIVKECSQKRYKGVVKVLYEGDNEVMVS
jgi:hypothetical protein